MILPRTPAHRTLPLRSLAVLLALVGALSPRVAQADPKDDARRHFREGLTAAQSGDFPTALEHFLDAQAAYPHPVTLYNIARAYQDLGDLDNALSTFTLYREAAPEHAADVDPVIAVLRARLHQETGANPTPEPPHPTTVGGAPSPELAQARAMLEQVQALLADVDTVPPTPIAPDTPPGPNPTNPVVAPAEPLPEPPAFQTAAYERVVVTASRFGQDPLDSPSAVTVLTADDIRLSGATSVPEVLRRVVGVDTMAMSAGHTDVSIRGFNRELSNKVLVLIDGRSTYLDFVGTTLWSTLAITLDEIDRIEVIRGPGSAIYGANAVTGVINIITRAPGEGQSTVTITAGAPGVLAGSAVATGRAGDDGFRLSVGWQEHARWGKEVDLTAAPSLTPSLANDDRALSTVHANGRLDHTLGDKGFTSVSAGYAQSRFEFYNIGALGDYALQDLHTYLRADAGYGPLLARAFWNHDVGQVGPWASPVGAAQSLNSPLRADTIDVELSVNGTATTGDVTHRLFAGVGYRRKHLARFTYLGDDGPTIDEDHFNAFLNEEATLGAVKLVASLRADAHPLIPLTRTLSPRAAAIFRVADHTALRVTGGSAFRVPTLVESYMDFRIPSGVNAVYIHDRGSQSLLPERVVTVEAGLHDESSDRHTADVAVFVNRLDNQIGLSPVVSVAAPYDPAAGGWAAGETGWINTSPVFVGWGAEASGELFPTDGLDLYATAAITRYGERSDGVTVQDSSTSTVKATAGASWHTRWRTDLSSDVQVASAQTWRLREFGPDGVLRINEETVPTRAIWSARAAVRPFNDERLELSVQGWNLGALGGDGVREHPKGQRVRSRVTGAIRYSF